MFCFNCYSFLGLLYILTKFYNVFCYDITYKKASTSAQDSEYVDPNSFYLDQVAKGVHASSRFQNLQYLQQDGNEIAIRKYEEKSEKYHLYCKDSPFEVFSRRLVNILISKSNFNLKGGLAIGKLNLEATEEQLAVLREFGKGKVSIRQVDSIISDVIQPIPVDLMEEVLNFADRLSIYIYQHRVIFGALLLIIFCLIIAHKVKWTRWRIMILVFDIIVIISFVLTWWELLKESEIKLMAKQAMYSKLPDECRLSEVNFLKSILLFFGWGKGDCVKYFEAVMTDPVFQVTPLHAFSHMWSKFFFSPLSLLAHNLTEFIEIVTDPLPWPFNHVARIILAVFVPFLVCGLIFLFFGGAMGLKIGPFFHIYLHGRQATPLENTVAYGDRQAIEVIRSETRESLPAPDTKALNQNIKTDQKTVSKKVKKSTQTEDFTTEYKEKVEESDTNSDEFPEEKEFEKISKKKLKKK